MKIYLVHYKALRSRINKIINLLLDCDFEDIEIITSEDSDLEFATTKENQPIVAKDWGLPAGWSFSARETTKPEQSLYHKHFRALRKIIDNKEPAIIFEDDVNFDPARLNEFVKECDSIPSDWDWCFFGTAVNPFGVDGTGFVKNNNKFKSRCTDSMLINPRAAQIIYDDILNNKAHFPIDWDLNYLFLKHTMSVYWYEPGFIIQESQNGTVESAINNY